MAGVAKRVARWCPKLGLLGRSDIEAGFASGDWKGKAGGYGIQGAAGAFVTGINGSYTAIVGLPLYETKALLEGMGWKNPPISREG